MAGCGGAFGASLNITGGASNRDFSMAIDVGGILAEYRNDAYWRDLIIDYGTQGQVTGCHLDGPGQVGAIISQGAVTHYQICSTPLGKGMVSFGYAFNGKYVPGPFGTPGKWTYRHTKAWVGCMKGM